MLGIVVQLVECLLNMNMALNSVSITSETGYGCMPVIEAIVKLRQEDLKFQDSLGYVVGTYLKKKTKSGGRGSRSNLIAPSRCEFRRLE